MVLQARKRRFDTQLHTETGKSSENDDDGTKSFSKNTFCINKKALVLFIFVVGSCVMLIYRRERSVHLSLVSPSLKFSPPSISQKTTRTFVTVILRSIIETETRPDRIEAIHKTWGPQANAFFIAHHNETYLSNFPTINVPNTIQSGHRLPAFYYAMRNVYEKINPDFLVFACDHTFLIPEHLAAHVDRLDPSQPILQGRMLAEKENKPESILLTPASGLLMSRELVNRVLRQLETGLKPCARKGDAYWNGKPDRALLECSRHLGVFPLDSRDGKLKNRFHSYGVVRVALAQYDEWYVNFHNNFAHMPGYFPFELVEGPDCCSRESISFHYVSAHEHFAFHRIRQKILAKPTASDSEIISWLKDSWPREKHELTPWSGKVPFEDSKKLLLVINVLRKISGAL